MCIRDSTKKRLYQYKCILQALRLGLKSTYFNSFYKNVADASRAASPICDWDEQVRILTSLDLVLAEFGVPENYTEQLVYSDWLEERNMRPLELPRLVSNLKLKSNPEAE